MAESYEERAASEIFNHHNPNYSFCKDSLKTNTLDLHGLRVREAEKYVREHIEAFKGLGAGVRNTTIITGRGNRSKDGIPKIKPAVLSFLKFNKYRYQVHRGHVVVEIDPE